MRRVLTATGRLMRRFVRDARAVAAVEFALILPPLLVLFLGSIEASSLITVDRRVTLVSSTMGDLVARWNPDDGAAIPAATLADYFEASEVIVYPYDNSAMRQVVTVVRVLQDDTTSVIWSCGYNGGEARTAGDPYVLPDHMRALARNSASRTLVVSLTRYSYTPVLGVVLDQLYNLRAESYYLPRYEVVIGEPVGC